MHHGPMHFTKSFIILTIITDYGAHLVRVWSAYKGLQIPNTCTYKYFKDYFRFVMYNGQTSVLSISHAAPFLFRKKRVFLSVYMIVWMY